MKFPCVIEVAFDTGPLGTRSRLADEIGGRPLLWWTVKKALAIEPVSKVYLAGRPADSSRVKHLLGDLSYEFLPVERTGSPAGENFARLRKWAVNSWQGGLGGATVFSEECLPASMLAVAKKADAGAVIKMSAHGPLADADLAARMARDYDPNLMVKLSNSPPGLGVEIYSADLAARMAKSGGSMDDILRLDLERPVREPSVMGIFTLAANEAAFTRARFLGDTARSFALLEALHARFGEEWINVPAVEIVRAYESDAALARWEFPREVEIEVTTAWEADSPFRTAIGERPAAHMEPELFARILENLSGVDDLCVTLGGNGDPLLHPELEALLNAAEVYGTFGLHIHTDGQAIDHHMVEILPASRVDVVSVALDAATEETYKRIKGKGSLADVSKRIDTLIRATDGKGPVVVPAFTLQEANRAEQEDFFKTRYASIGWTVIRRQDDFAGRIPGKVPLPLTLGRRGVCEHLLERMYVAADGGIGACVQDYDASLDAGSAPDLADAWGGGALCGLVEGHARGDFNTFPLCAKCKRWCMP